MADTWQSEDKPQEEQKSTLSRWLTNPFGGGAGVLVVGKVLNGAIKALKKPHPPKHGEPEDPFDNWDA